MRLKFQLAYVFSLFQLSINIALSDSLNYDEKFDVGVHYYKEKRYKLALNHFKKMYADKKNIQDPALHLFLAKSLNQNGSIDDAKNVSKSFLTKFPKSQYLSDIYLLLGDISLTKGNASLGLKHYLSARSLVDDLMYINEIDDRIYSCIGVGLEVEKLEVLLFREKNPFNRAIINLARSYQNWVEGDIYDAETFIDEIDSFYLPGRFASLYSNIKKLSKMGDLKPVTFAVLLPLSGINKEKGYSYLLGLSEYLDSEKSTNFIRFIVYDTGGSAINTLNIVNNLDHNKNITAIIGPLTNEEIFALAGNNLKLPVLVPHSAPPGLSDIAGNLFFLSPSYKTIAELNAQMMIQELGFKNIAVLSPATGNIKLTTDYFLNECYQLGVDPVAIEWYVEKPTNLSRQLKKIRRKAWDLLPKDDTKDDFLNIEIDSIDALFDVDIVDFFELPKEEDQKMDKKDSAKVVLETIEAIYIPIRPDELRYIGTQLPIYNLNTLLFGNQNWLDLNLLNQEVIGPHVQGMRIISDVSSVLSEDNQNSYLNFYNIAIEHAFFIQSIIEKTMDNPRKFKSELASHTGYYGKKTSIKFTGMMNNENGSAQVLEYSKNKIKTLGIYDGNTFSHTSK